MEKATGVRKNILETLRLYKNLPTANATIVSAVSALEEPIRRTRANSLERQRKYTEVPVTGGGSAAASRLPAIETRRLNSRVHTPNDVNDGWTPIVKGRGRPTNNGWTTVMPTPRGGNTTRGRGGATRGRGGAAPRGGRPSTGGKKTRKLNRQK